MRLLGYLRVSTNEQAESGAGLAAQRSAITAEVSRRGWDPAAIEWIEDAGYSGKDVRRPGLTAGLGILKAEKDAILLVSKMDRLSRSLLDFCTIMQQAQKEGWKLVALDSPADLTTASGEAMAGVLMVFSQLERRLIGERTKAALQVRREAGVRLGRPRTLPAAVVARMSAQRTSGATFKAIADALNADAIPTAQGGREWYPATVRKVLLST